MHTPRSLRLSLPAGQGFAKVKQLLTDHPGFLHYPTASVTLEFLCEHFLNSVPLTKFKPKTFRGRPPGPNFYYNVKPVHIRKEVGRLERELDGG